MKNLFLIVLVILGIQSSTFSQSPWNNKKGSFYAQAAFTSIRYGFAFDNEGNVQELSANVLDQTYTGFLDYSLTDRIALTGMVPTKRVGFDGDQLIALGDIDLKARYQIIKDVPFTVYGGYTFPTATKEGPLRTGFKVNAVEGGLAYGRSNSEIHSSFSAGYRLRNSIPDQIIIGIEIGTSISTGALELLMALRVDGAINTSQPTEFDALTQESNLHNYNGQFLSPGIKIGTKLKSGFSINLGSYGAFFAQNQGAAPSINLSVAYELEKSDEQ